MVDNQSRDLNIRFLLVVYLPLPPPENNDLVVGAGQFMTAWLTLMEKLIDVKSVTESNHSLPASFQPAQFEPIRFLAKSHKVN